MRKIKKSLYELITKKTEALLRAESVLVEPKDINGVISSAMQYQDLVYSEKRSIIQIAMRAVYTVLGIVLLYFLLRR